jgi:capsular polysaccharide export protein
MRLQQQFGLLRAEPAPATPPPERFVFLPLQVSTDTNLLLFSEQNAQQALQIAEARAGELGARLVVKPHPAERNIKRLRELRAYCTAKGHLWTGFNTTALILGAEEVVTINSTVGLTAIALERPVRVLGRSLYARFTPRQAAVFVLRHLVDIDPFSTAPASQGAVDHFLSIMAMSKPEDVEPRSAPWAPAGSGPEDHPARAPSL